MRNHFIDGSSDRRNAKVEPSSSTAISRKSPLDMNKVKTPIKDDKSMRSEAKTATTAQKSQNSGNSYIPGNVVSVVRYIVDTVEAITESICNKIPSIPLAIKHFIRAIYDHGRANNHDDLYTFNQIAKYLIDEWLGKVAFEEMVENGFCKVYQIQSNAHQNFKLMKIVLIKIFRLDDFEFEEQVLFPLNQLYDKKKADILKFYKTLVDSASEKHSKSS
mmetsp:Transcript_8484/g.12983  ORF Transcript_8484/g.12983 Transcript_8484/m.12983 type:complete len:218 (+) Transcript_8484:1601-2254(+)